MSAPVIFTYNLKGGVAKTTTVVNLAAVLGKMGKRVLVVDLDPQSAATWMLAVGPQQMGDSTYAAIMGAKPMTDVIKRSRFENVDVAPSSEDLYGLDADIEAVPHNREQLLNTALAPVRNSYDLIMIDSHNKYGLTELNALRAADRLLIPVSCGFLPFWGLNQLHHLVGRAETRYNHPIEVLGYVVTMYRRKMLNLASENKEIERQLREKYGGQVFSTVIDYDENIDVAAMHQEPVAYYLQHTRGTREYDQLAEEVLGRLHHDGHAVRPTEGVTANV
jgi:chromosome partitioning protein